MKNPIVLKAFALKKTGASKIEAVGKAENRSVRDAPATRMTVVMRDERGCPSGRFDIVLPPIPAGAVHRFAALTPLNAPGFFRFEASAPLTERPD